jgi:hypothetical protein
MPEIRYEFRCYHEQCRQVTEVVQTVPDIRKAGLDDDSKLPRTPIR